MHRLQLPELKLEAYKIFVRPLLEYCSHFLSFTEQVDSSRIERIQRAFTKSLLGTTNTLNYYERSIKLQIEPLWLRRLKHNLVLFFKTLNGLSALSFQTIQLNTNNGYNLRDRVGKIRVPRTKLEIRRKSFLILYSSLWNKLPTIVRSSECTSTFKQRLCHFLTPDNLQKLTLDRSKSIISLYNEGINPV